MIQSELCSDAQSEPVGTPNSKTLLNYRLALTLNSLTLLTSDSAAAVDSSVNIQLANGSYLTANNIRSAAQSLAAANVRPLVNDSFGALIHPWVVRDVFNDTSVNGLSDVVKRDPAMAKMLFKMPANDETFDWGGIKFKQTTTVPSVTISGNTYYNTYVYGDDALFSIFLGKAESGDKNYKLFIQNAPENGSVSDPARQIGGEPQPCRR